MKKFKFRLQRVLDVRELEEQVKMKQVAQAQTDHEKQSDLLFQLKNEEQSSMQAIDRLQKKPVDAGMVNLFMLSLKGRRLQKELQLQKVFDAQNNLSYCRENLLIATKKKKVLQKLKDVKLERYMDHVRKEEQKFIDESASINTHRKSNHT